MKAVPLIILVSLAVQVRVVPPPPPPPPAPVRVSGPIAATGDGLIQGTVLRVDNGAPVSGALITVTGPPGSNGAVPQLNVQTDSSGQFVFRNIPSGVYSVAARLADYWGTASASNINGQRVAAAVAFIDEASKTARIVLNLTPGGGIQGIVRAPDGEAPPNTEVSLWRVTYRDGLRALQKIRTVRANAEGAYVFAGLPPAEFYVKAEAMNGSNAMAYYPGVTDPELAVAVRIRGGDEVIADIQTVSALALRISGNIVNAIPELAETPVALMLVPSDLSRLVERDPTRWFANQTPAAPEGRFEIFVAQPGTYHLMPVAAARRDTSPAPFPARPQFYTGRTTVDVRDRDVESVSLVVTGGSSLTVRASFPRGLFPSVPFVLSLRPIDPHRTILHDHLTNRALPPEGSVTFSNVPEGKYHLVAEGPAGLPVGALPLGFYIQDVVQSGRSIAGDGVITVGGNNADGVELVMAEGGGQVDVVVDWGVGKTETTASVSLAPQGLKRTNPMFYRRAYVTDGQVHFTDVAPGDYRVFAWEDLSEGADQNFNFMSRLDTQGSPVTVRANSTAISIRVPVIPTR